MRNFDKTILTCAVTGAIHVPSMSPHLPITPDEIAKEAIAAADAGASIVHIHVRNPETGEPVQDVDLFREVVTEIKSECNAVIQPTTGGGLGMSLEERVAVVPELEPEIASCNMGSFNFGLYQISEVIDEFEYEWEREYLDNTRDFIFQNTFSDLEEVLQIFSDHKTKPELECYDVGHLYNAKHFVDRGLLEPPIHIQFVMGILGGIAADPDNLTHLIHTADKLFGNDYSYSVLGAGRQQFPMGAQAISMDGHARVGMEDNLYLRRGELAESNAELVEKMVDLTSELTGSEIATPDEVREFLDLKGPSKVNF